MTIAAALDAILGLVVLEGVALILIHRRTGKGVAPRDLVFNLLAGFFLMLTARLALAPTAPAIALAGCLLLALVAHLADLATRWRR